MYTHFSAERRSVTNACYFQISLAGFQVEFLCSDIR